MTDPAATAPRRRCVALIIAALGALVASTATSASSSFAAGSPPPAPQGVATAQPQVTLPTVSPAITEGQPPAALLAKAVALLDAGNQAAPIQPALSALRGNVNADTVAATQAAAAAAARSASAAAAAGAERSNAASLNQQLRRAALSLYMSGQSVALPQVTPAGGHSVAAAVVGVQLALSPKGLLAARQRAVSAADSQAIRARSDQVAARAAAVQADRAQRARASQTLQLQTQTAVLPSPTASLLSAEQATLSQQAGSALRAGNALQFTPAAPLPPPVATTEVALTWLFSELGKTYVYGATGPDTFDCSGLTQFVWNKAGVQTPRVAADQDTWAVPVPLSDLRPGDLVFYGTTDIHHMGMYIGGGLMINAPHTGDVVRVSPIFYADLAGFGWPHAVGVPVPAHGLPSVASPATPAVVSTVGTVPSQATPPAGVAPVTEPPVTSSPSTTPGTTSVPSPTSSTPTPTSTSTTRPTTSTSTQVR